MTRQHPSSTSAPDASRSGRARGREALLQLAPPLRRLVEERRRLLTDETELRKKVRRATQRLHVLEEENRRLRVAALGEGRHDLTPARHLDYLFVIAYGRSGSTLLQGILCSIPGYLIRGENNDAFYRLYGFHRRLTEGRNSIPAGRILGPTSSWYGIERYDPQIGIEALRSLALDTLLLPEPDTRVTGFKEIRWWHKDWQNYLGFLRTLFPGARFVINVRNHDAVSRSKWWANNPDALGKLARYEAQLDAMADHLGDSAYRVNFDEYVADHDVLRGLFEWLDEPFDRARLDEVMAVKHSS